MYLCAVASPFIGSALAGLAGRWLGARGSGVVTVLGLATSAILRAFIWHETALQGRNVCLDLGSWFGVNTVQVRWLLSFDALTACMMLTVTSVSFCVHLYRLAYMQADPHLPRFLSYLSLFTASMLFLVSGTDLLTLLVGWEMIGVCSYLLIGFWFHRLSATKAAQKAVLVNRVRDTGLLVGLLIAWWYTGRTDLILINSRATVASYTNWLCFALLAGALGKSAQVGLHVWLADAMEGPTPVSALIHAATLVTAGVYLIARTNGVWECSRIGRQTLIAVGAVTRLMAATMGLVQNDLKRVIAYSTCRQLGYMTVACGLSHYSLAIYHLMTHACFKALLFLGAGVVIHATADIQDLRRQGGGHRALPWAWACLLLGSLSLVGWPFLAGYYRKDAILELAWATPGALSSYRYFILIIVAALTRTYSFRVLLCSFYESPSARLKEIRTPGIPFAMAFPLLILSIGRITAGYFLREGLIGWGSDMFQNSIFGAPATIHPVASHMIPVWASYLPLASVFLGLRIARAFTWPMPWAIEKFWKRIYLFLMARWQFDFVWNQQVAAPLLQLGSYTWMLLDKGILELLGPKGLSAIVTNWALPRIKNWQTGRVHDYALVFQVLVILGLRALALPQWWMEGLLIHPHAYMLALLFLVLAPSFSKT
jgi:NADH-quinone oxidoreductase subunit L